MLKAKFLAALAAASLVATPARADGACAGTVAVAYVYYTGAVMIFSSWRNNLTEICNLKEPKQSVSTEVCWAWFAKINEAVTANKTVTLWYSAISSSAECATLPIYGDAPAPIYVAING